MSTSHTFYSDTPIRFLIDTDPDSPSLFIYHADTETRHFMKLENLQQLADQITVALAKPEKVSQPQDAT